MIFELPDIFFGSHPKKEMASQPLQVRQYGFAKNSKKPYHKRIFKKSGDIFFGATSHQNSRFLIENGCFFRAHGIIPPLWADMRCHLPADKL